MGDPKKSRKTYKKPSHPWQKTRIDEEKELKKSYAYKNKKELWKQGTILAKYRAQARRLISLVGTKQGDLERKQLIQKLNQYGLVTDKAGIDDVLNLTLIELLDRRLQTIVFNSGKSNTIKQARQLITHGHVFVKGSKITSPSYLTTKEEEKHISIKKNTLVNVLGSKMKTIEIIKEDEKIVETEMKNDKVKELKKPIKSGES